MVWSGRDGAEDWGINAKMLQTIMCVQHVQVSQLKDAVWAQDAPQCYVPRFIMSPNSEHKVEFSRRAVRFWFQKVEVI